MLLRNIFDLTSEEPTIVEPPQTKANEAFEKVKALLDGNESVRKLLETLLAPRRRCDGSPLVNVEGLVTESSTLQRKDTKFNDGK